MATVTLKSRFPEAAAKAREAAVVAVARAAIDWQALAQLAAPVDTGFLRSSIRATQIDDLTWRIEVGAEYGIYVEFGTVHMAAQPYFVPAGDQAFARLKAELARVFGSLL